MLTLGLGVVAGIAAAKMLLANEMPEAVPEPLRLPWTEAQKKLLRWRARAREAIDAARAADVQAQRDLQAEYLRRGKQRA